MYTDSQQLHCRFYLDTTSGAFLSEDRVGLLEAIDRHGSITWAAKSLGISYKSAWELIDHMNQQARYPVVVRIAGGRHGGGTSLTDYGRRLAAFYRALEKDYKSTIRDLSFHLDQNSGLCNFRYLLKRRAIQKWFIPLLSGSRGRS